MRRNFIFATALVILVLIAFWGHYLGQIEKTHLDTLTFTNTMEWDPSFFIKAKKNPYFVSDFKDKIVLFPPPTNSSIEVRHEIDTLLLFQKNRTMPQISVIKNQVSSYTINFGGYMIFDYLNPKLYPKTAPLLSLALVDLETIILYEKLQFNRVRPSALDSKIVPAIEVPGHPAYPSGHSTQMHFLALFLGELNPSNKINLWVEADAIAKNREIAGLHYPSDSVAGVSLAKQVFILMMANPEFKKRFDDARFEWQ